MGRRDRLHGHDPAAVFRLRLLLAVGRLDVVERRAAGVKFINDLISGIIMTTATKSTIKLPVVSEPHFVPGNCFRYYAFQESAKEDDPCEENENTAASHNYLKGLRSLHEGYLAGSLLHTSVQNDRFQRAFGYFHRSPYRKTRLFLRAGSFKVRGGTPWL